MYVLPGWHVNVLALWQYPGQEESLFRTIQAGSCGQLQWHPLDLLPAMSGRIAACLHTYICNSSVPAQASTTVEVCIVAHALWLCLQL